MDYKSEMKKSIVISMLVAGLFFYGNVATAAENVTTPQEITSEYDKGSATLNDGDELNKNQENNVPTENATSGSENTDNQEGGNTITNPDNVNADNDGNNVEKHDDVKIPENGANDIDSSATDSEILPPIMVEIPEYSYTVFNEVEIPSFTIEQVLIEIDKDGNKCYRDLANNILTGFNSIDGKLYYMDENGKPETGKVSVAGKVYFFENDGVMCKGEWKTVNGKRYYFNEEDGSAVDGWLMLDGQKYWFKNHEMFTGLTHIANDLYYFKSNGMMAYGWESVRGYMYNFGEDGKAKNGFAKLGKDTYWFDNYKLRTGFARDAEGDLYWFKDSGVMAYGWEFVNGSMYNFGEDGKAKNGFAKLGKDTYWLDNYKLRTGFARDAKGDLYWFKDSGVMAYGWEFVNGSMYNFGEDGKAKNGFCKLGDNTYYFENNKLRTGFVRDAEGNLYWFNGNGVMVYGWEFIGGYMYNFGEDGKAKNGWFELNSNKYYLSNYHLVTGFQRINGDTYWFNDNGIMEIGYRVINGRLYNFGKDGKMICDLPFAEENLWRTTNLTSPTNYLILVDKSACHTMIYTKSGNGWAPYKDWLCTPGKPSTPSLSGIYHVQGKGNSFGWDKGYTCWYYTQISGNYLFHSVIYQMGSKTNVIDGRLGQQLSHGCVRLSLENAKWMYDNIPVGTTIYLY